MKRSPWSGNRIPSLDGLRAVAIMLVMFGHATERLAQTNQLTAWQSVTREAFGNGDFGVQIFFVLSGFLITTLLLIERERTGSINLLSFYVRRAFRILPAYYFYILVIACFSIVGLIDVRPRDFLYATTFTWIYNFGKANWYLTHSWSLAVEEQFYLAWPVALMVVGPRRGVFLAISMLGIVPLAGLFMTIVPRGYLHRGCFILSRSHADVLMLGCLVALCWQTQYFGSIIDWLLRWRLALPLLCLGQALWTVVHLHPQTQPILVPLCRPVYGSAIALAMACFVVDPSSQIARFLNSPLVSQVGVMSYSLYLWQEPFLVPMKPIGVLQILPLNLVASFGMAAISYYLVESTMLGLRKQLFGGPQVPRAPQPSDGVIETLASIEKPSGKMA